MAYIIGNTTVIDNNGALGAVSGNSLNLANNSNISAGGASSTTYNSSSPSVSTPTISPSGGGAVIGLLGGGGGGGGGQNNGGGSGYGSPGGQTLDFIDMSPGGNIGFLVGSGGNGGYYQPYGWSFSGQAGGRSYSPFPTNANISAFGGRGGAKSMMPNSSPQPGFSGPRTGAGGINPAYGYGILYNPSVGTGGNPGGFRGAGNAGSSGQIRVFGL